MNCAFLGWRGVRHRRSTQDGDLRVGETSRRERRLATSYGVETVYFLAHVMLSALSVDFLDQADEFDDRSAQIARSGDDLAPLDELDPLDPEGEEVTGRFLVWRSRDPAEQVGTTVSATESVRVCEVA